MRSIGQMTYPSSGVTNLVRPQSGLMHSPRVSAFAPSRPATPPVKPKSTTTAAKPASTKPTPKKAAKLAAAIDHNRRARGIGYRTAFGDQGMTWFAQGLTFAEAQKRFDAQQTANRDAAKFRADREFNLGAAGRVANGIKFVKPAPVVFAK